MAQGLVHAVKRLLGGAEAPQEVEIIPPERSLQRVQSNIEELQATLEPGQDLILRDSYVSNDNVITTIDVHPHHVELTNHSTHEHRLVRLDDTLEEYRALEEDIRFQLARKISRLLPDLAESKQKILLDHTAGVLKTIAQDQTERVRMMLSEELADQPDAPYEVVQMLAWDHRLKISGPILEFSPLLGDQELIEILSTSDVPGVAESIAKRKHVSEDVSSAVVATHHPQAIRNLLENKGSHINEDAMALIVADAPEQEIWHPGLITRPELTQKTVNRIAGFISRQLMEELEKYQTLHQKTRQNTQRAVTSRLKSWTTDQERGGELRAKQYYKAGRLDNEMIDNAIHAIDEPFVIAALALRGGYSKDKVKRVLQSDSPRAITALAWKAGLSMRTAMSLQMKIGRIHHTRMLNARGGTDYPVSEDELQEFADMFLE